MISVENIEICCNSRLSAENAKRGGAVRIELCRELQCGGLTPGMDDVEYCVRKLGLETRVLIRPRPGDFCYNDEDWDSVRRDVARCGEIGARAVVVGFLLENGEIDMQRTKEAVRLAGNMEVTFHRAFDEKLRTADDLELLMECGCSKLLTSGCAPTAAEGIEVLRRLQAASAGSIGIVAASGITPQNAAEIVARTGVSEVHGSCKVCRNGVMSTSEEQVRYLIRRLTNLG